MIGRPANALIVHWLDGDLWGASRQPHCSRPALGRRSHRPLPRLAIHLCVHAGYAGVPMGVFAAQLGHSDTRMTEKQYAHLPPSYVAETVRTNMPDLGIVAVRETDVIPMVPAVRT